MYICIYVLCKRELRCQDWELDTHHVHPLGLEPKTVEEFCGFTLNYMYYFKDYKVLKFKLGTAELICVRGLGNTLYTVLVYVLYICII